MKEKPQSIKIGKFDMPENLSTDLQDLINSLPKKEYHGFKRYHGN
jgi:hypothetical protein